MWALPLMAAAQYTGKVFVDENHNGRWDKGERLMGIVPPLNDGLVASQGVVYAGTGKMLWASYIGNRPSTVETSPLVAGGIVYLGASDGVIYALDAAKGTLLWKHATGVPVFASMAVSGNCLYAADFSGNVYGFACE